MTEENNPESEASFIDTLDANIQALVAQTQIFWLELRLATHSIGVYLGLLAILVLLIISSWICLIATIAMLLMAAGCSALLAVSLTFLINVLIVAAVILLIKKTVVNFKFKETRKLLQGKQHDS